MLVTFIMTLLIYLSNPYRVRKHVENSAYPLYFTEPIYNVSQWVRVLHLQQCVFVEIGEKYCAVFVEVRSKRTKAVEEYFLGICDFNALYKWKLCPVALEKERPKDCLFKKDLEKFDVDARVHRRLCDVTGLAFYGDPCDCSPLFASQRLHRVTGFPTCFSSPLPDSICLPRNVCGTYNCQSTTVLDKIHAVKCDPNCFGKQPFCEEPGLETSKPLEVTSFWSDWRQPDCNGPCPSSPFKIREAECVNSKTGMGAIDCLGPGTNCCPADEEHCKCNVFVEDGILKVVRTIILEHVKGPEENKANNFAEIGLKRIRRERKLEQYFDEDGRIRREKEEEEYSDDDFDFDDEDETDTTEEDIAIEEEIMENTEETVATTEEKEKDELDNTTVSSRSGKYKNVFEEAPPDRNSSLSQIKRCFRNSVFIFILVLFGYLFKD